MIPAEDFFLELKNKLDSDSSINFSNDFFESLTRALPILGDPRGEIRDQLAWSTLSRLFRASLFPPQKRWDFVKTISGPEYLFFQIDKENPHSALRRSFSVLTLADLVSGDFEPSSFSKQQLQVLLESLLDYLSKESDNRGFVDGVGWVHCLAHSGDALSALCRHPNADSTIRMSIAKAIQKAIERQGFNVFHWGEEQRLGRPFAQALFHLDPELLSDQLLSIYTKEYMFENPWRQNVLNSLRCTYLELHWMGYSNVGILKKLRDVIA